MHLKDCVVEVFKLICQPGNLKCLKTEEVIVRHLAIEGAVKNPEVAGIHNFMVMWPKLYQMILRASDIKTLWLWEVMFEKENMILQRSLPRASQTIIDFLPG